jgi:hypothetical protein
MRQYLARVVKLPTELREKARDTYVELGHKLVVSLLSPINKFARHLIVLQGKDPNYIAPSPPPEPTLKDAMPARPSFRFNETRGWTQAYLKKPAENHPIIKLRKQLESEGGLRDKAAEELAAKAAAAVADEAPLQRTIPDPIADLRKAFSELRFDEKKAEDLLDEVQMDEIEMTSGTRAVPKAKTKVAAKKAKSPKKAVRVKKTKKGVFSRVED